MSWESNASSCTDEMPPILDDGVDGDSIEKKLQNLALKASPAMQKEIDDILNSLSGKSMHLYGFLMD
jgi:hypothetical protein